MAAPYLHANAPRQPGYRMLCHKTAEAIGSPWAFVAGIAIVIIWAAAGPIFHYSDTWQLVINTGTTIATFLIVFLIQNTQNRDAKVMQLKLDELIRAVGEARTELVSMEQLTDQELDELHKEFERVQARAARHLAQIESLKSKGLKNTTSSVS